MRMSLEPTALLKIFLPFCKIRLQTALHGVEISATCQMQQKLGRFPQQRVTADTTHYSADTQPTPATSTYQMQPNTSHGNRDTRMYSYRLPTYQTVPTTAKFIYRTSFLAKVSDLLRSAAVLFDK